jgi:hypothetical protein
MARVSGSVGEQYYAAALRFVNAALRADDSLFTPGRRSGRWRMSRTCTGASSRTPTRAATASRSSFAASSPTAPPTAAPTAAPATVPPVAAALVARGAIKAAQKDYQGAIADYTQAQLPG